MKEFNRLTVKVYAWFTKTLNGSNGKSSYLMKGADVPYQFKGRSDIKVSELESFIQENKELLLDDISELRVKAKEKNEDTKIRVTYFKEGYGSSRVVKGIRGAIRHRIMDILYKKGIDYCIPTQKVQFTKSEESTLLDGEHLMGNCGENSCPIRQLFGMLGEKSPIRVWSDVLVQTDKSSENVIAQKGLSFVHISTENRHASRRDCKVLQDFDEQYFSGEFNFYVEFSEELPDWLLGLLIEGILNITHLGGRSSSGYGRIEIKGLTYEHISFERKLGSETNGAIAIIEEEQTVNLNEQVAECLEAWNKHK